MDTSVSDAAAGTLRRGLSILRALEKAGPEGLKIAEIARATDVPRPTVYRLIETLVECGFARPADDDGRYAAFSPAKPGRTRSPWAALTQRFTVPMRRIAETTGDSVFLVRRDAQDAVCLQREFGTFPIQVHAIKVGGRQPLGVGAAGLALLAAHTDDEVDRLLSRIATRMADYGGLYESKIRLLIASTRTRGYSVIANHAVKGVLGVGIVIRDRQGTPIAGLSVSTIVERMPVARQRQIAALMQAEVRI